MSRCDIKLGTVVQADVLLGTVDLREGTLQKFCPGSRTPKIQSIVARVVHVPKGVFQIMEVKFVC